MKRVDNVRVLAQTSWRMAAVLLFAVTIGAGCSGPNSRDSQTEKAEWALLQSVEVSHRGTPIVAPTVLEAWEHEVLGVRGFDGQNIWVLLKPAAPPYYKQIPRGNYELPEEFVDQLVKDRRLSYTVEHVLTSRATE